MPPEPSSKRTRTSYARCSAPPLLSAAPVAAPAVAPNNVEGPRPRNSAPPMSAPAAAPATGWPWTRCTTWLTDSTRPIWPTLDDGLPVHVLVVVECVAQPNAVSTTAMHDDFHMRSRSARHVPPVRGIAVAAPQRVGE